MTQWYFAHIVLVQATFTNILLALSLQIPFRFGVFSFAGVGAFGFGSYFAGIAVRQFQWPSFLAVFVAVVVAAAFSALLSLVLRRLTGLYLGMATIAFCLILGVVAVNGGPLTGGAIGIFGVISQPRVETYHLILVVVAVIALSVWSERGRFSRAVLAVQHDPELSTALGIELYRFRTLAFAVSGAVGAAGGALDIFVRTTVGPNDIGFKLIVLALTMVVIGGTSSWVGAVIGATLLTWLSTLLEFLGNVETLIYGALVVLIAVYAPGGLVGLGRDLIRRLQSRRERARAGSQVVGSEK